MPTFVEPMRPSLAAKPFSDAAYLFELKLDGWRTLCFLREGSPPGIPQTKQLNERFPELRDIGELIKAKTALIDGEVVALDRDGLPRFDALRSRRRNCSVVLYAFDLLPDLISQAAPRVVAAREEIEMVEQRRLSLREPRACQCRRHSR